MHYSLCTGYDNTAYVDYMDLAVRERPLNLITHSLTQHNTDPPA